MCPIKISNWINPVHLREAKLDVIVILELVGQHSKTCKVPTVDQHPIANQMLGISVAHIDDQNAFRVYGLEINNSVYLRFKKMFINLPPHVYHCVFLVLHECISRLPYNMPCSKNIFEVSTYIEDSQCFIPGCNFDHNFSFFSYILFIPNTSKALMSRFKEPARCK